MVAAGFKLGKGILQLKLARNLVPRPLPVWALRAIALTRYEIGRFSPVLEALPFHGGDMPRLLTLDLVEGLNCI